MFRGREQSRPELGFRLLKRLADDVADLGWVEYSPKQDGRNMIMVLGPHKKKAEAMAEAKAGREAEKQARRGERPGDSPSEPAMDAAAPATPEPALAQEGPGTDQAPLAAVEATTQA
jgi:translation initiation factor IF-3